MSAKTAIASGALAFCLGIGFSSVVSIALIAIGTAPATNAFVLLDLAVWSIVAALGWFIKPAATASTPIFRSPSPGIDRRERRLAAAFIAIAMVALVSVIASLRALPHGLWDAWAIWNLHARFLYSGSAGAWRDVFSIGWSQPDYPLLLPASVARVWAYAGYESTLGPILIALGFGIACVTLLVTALGGWRGWIAGAVVLGASTFLMQVSSQFADVPLSCFIVATFAIMYGDVPWSPEPGSRTPALLAGATSAMAAWTKNEGVVLLLLILIVAGVFAVRRRDGRQLVWLIAGALPMVIAVVWFKLTLAPESALVGQSLGAMFARLLDPDRHAMVLSLMWQYAARWSPPVTIAIFPVMCLLAAWMAVRRRGAVRAMASVLGLMLLSYYLIYVTTPYDITWHVSTSMDRLLVQLWPTLVLTVFIDMKPEGTSIQVPFHDHISVPPA